MVAEVNADAYMLPRPRNEGILQVGFAPSPKLDAALRGFLLPERLIENHRKDDQSKSRGAGKDRSVGRIVLRSMRRQQFDFHDSANDGIRYFNESELMAEKIRLKKLQNEMVAVADIGLVLAKNNDIVLGFRLHPTDDQRSKLSNPILGDLHAKDANLDVYVRFNHEDIPDDMAATVKHAKDIKRSIDLARRLNTESPLIPIPSPYFVREPQIIEG